LDLPIFGVMWETSCHMISDVRDMLIRDIYGVSGPEIPFFRASAGIAG